MLATLQVLKVTKTVQMEEANIGKLINMLSTDTGRFEFLAFQFHMLYIAPIQCTVLFYFLWEEFGIACFTGVGLIVGLLMPLQGEIQKFMSLLRYIRRILHSCFYK
jgi:hypothetical protein